jgi:prevent-host-death family protein
MTALTLPAKAATAPPSFAVHELKNQLSAVLAQVQAGTTAVITSHRKPIAKLVPIMAELSGSEAPQALNKASVADVPDAEGELRDLSLYPDIPGVIWSKRKFKFDPSFKPITLVGEGPTVSEILIMQRRGEYVG